MTQTNEVFFKMKVQVTDSLNVFANCGSASKDKLSRMHLFEKAYSDTLGVARNSFMEAKQRAIRHVYWTENRFADKIGRWINRTLNTTYLV